jgi:phosphatidate cytidylyltransferase
MSLDASQLTVLGFFLALTLSLPLRRAARLPRPVAVYLPYLWTFFLVFALLELASQALGIWILAGLSFLALREYFTLTDLRYQDRWAVLAAYAAIPFMYAFVQTDWYGMFIISVPVYAFLVIPFVVAVGGREPRGSVLSTGIIILGLFLLVYCIGHVAYLARVSAWSAAYVVLAVALCDLMAYVLRARDRPPLHAALLQLLAPAPLTVALALLLMPLTGVPAPQSVAVALLIPPLVAMGCHTIDHLEADLGIDRARLSPGRGQLLNTLKSFVYAAPVAFHYLRWATDLF